MKNIGVLLLVIAAACQPSAQANEDQPERRFVRALELFDQAKSPADYRKAATELEALATDGLRNGAVFYNLGNAYMRAGQFGRAILAYRKAKVFRPRDPYLDANLRQALTAAPGRLPEQPEPLWKLLLFWSGWLSLPEKMYAVLGAWTLGAVLLAAGIFFGWRRTPWIVGLVCAAALALSVEAALAQQANPDGMVAVITQESLARKGDGESYEPAFDRALQDGAEFVILERKGGWILGEFPGAGRGWVRSEAVAE